MSHKFTVTLPVAWATFSVDVSPEAYRAAVKSLGGDELLAVNALVAAGYARLSGETETSATFYPVAE